jgi:hypothetical protein
VHDEEGFHLEQQQTEAIIKVLSWLAAPGSTADMICPLSHRRPARFGWPSPTRSKRGTRTSGIGNLGHAAVDAAGRDQVTRADNGGLVEDGHVGRHRAAGSGGPRSGWRSRWTAGASLPAMMDTSKDHRDAGPAAGRCT